LSEKPPFLAKGIFTFTSSLTVQKPAVERGGRGGAVITHPALPSPPPYFPADPWIVHFKDDVTVILLLDVSFMQQQNVLPQKDDIL